MRSRVLTKIHELLVLQQLLIDVRYWCCLPEAPVGIILDAASRFYPPLAHQVQRHDR